jgi:hypothetical protein
MRKEHDRTRKGQVRAGKEQKRNRKEQDAYLAAEISCSPLPLFSSSHALAFPSSALLVSNLSTANLTMASTTSNILERLLPMIWACLSIPAWKNPIINQFLTSEVIISELCTAASLTFCAGLYETIQANSPPSIEFFKRIPTENSQRWGIYAVVLEKPGAVPLIYIGSGTNATDGVKTRLNQYNRLDVLTMPRFVDAALKDGFQIVHKGLLMWCPIPSATDRPRYRLLFIAIEATFCFLFWALKTRKPDHYMSSCCPWPLSSFSYGGLCSHSPLKEGIYGNFDLSAEQLEAIATEVKDKKRAHNHRMFVRERTLKPEHYKERTSRNGRLYRERWREKSLAMKERSRKKKKESKQLYCTLCGVSCASSYELTRHNASKRHLLKVAKEESGVVNKYRCDICSFSAAYPCLLERHCQGMRHLQKLAAVKSTESI